MDLEHLSFTIREKTVKIFELKKKLEKSEKRRNLSISLTVPVSCYVVLFNQRYINYSLAIFNPGGKILSSSFFSIDVIVILILVCLGVFMFTAFSEYNKAKASYNDFRKDLIKSIDSDFCKCSQSQACKDKYMEEMKKYGIYLAF